MRKQAEKELAALGKQLGLNANYYVMKFGSIKKEILRVAQERQIDLIIIGSHGKHGLGRLLGSTANAIVHGAQCDVLIVRPLGK